MSAVTSLGKAASDAAGASNVTGFAAMTSQQFVKIMMTELTNQDPLKPNDSSALLQQMSQLRSIESDMNLSNKLNALVTQNQFSAASGVIGAVVSGVSTDNQRVRGIVASISRTADGPVLNLSTGQRIAFGNVDEIVDPRTLPQDPTDPNNPNNPTDPGNPTTPTAPSGAALDPDAGRPIPQNLDPSLAPLLGGRGD
ncbi:MAG: flagellar hook capping FlgD N-terminal domain-containing protein [Phycisphaerales bacterium]